MKGITESTEEGNQIVVYQPDDTVSLDVRLENDTVWLTQAQMTVLFQRDRTVVTRHINNVFAEGELDEKSNVHFLHIALSDKPVKLYSLNVVISVGYRVKSFRGTQFRIWATNILREYLLHGYAFNHRLNALEDKVDRRMAKTEQDVVELKEKVDFFVQTSLPPLRGVFYNGEVFDAHVFAAKLILSAKKSILLIDSWVDVVTLELLAKKSNGVTVEVVTSKRGNKISASDAAKFNSQHGGLTLTISKNFHDRFIAIDGKKLYLIGASLKDLGSKCFAFTELDAGEIPNLIARI